MNLVNVNWGKLSAEQDFLSSGFKRMQVGERGMMEEGRRRLKFPCPGGVGSYFMCLKRMRTSFKVKRWWQGTVWVQTYRAVPITRDGEAKGLVWGDQNPEWSTSTNSCHYKVIYKCCAARAAWTVLLRSAILPGPLHMLHITTFVHFLLQHLEAPVNHAWYHRALQIISFTVCHFYIHHTQNFTWCHQPN